MPRLQVRTRVSRQSPPALGVDADEVRRASRRSNPTDCTARAGVAANGQDRVRLVAPGRRVAGQDRLDGRRQVGGEVNDCQRAQLTIGRQPTAPLACGTGQRRSAQCDPRYRPEPAKPPCVSRGGAGSPSGGPEHDGATDVRPSRDLRVDGSERSAWPAPRRRCRCPQRGGPRTRRSRSATGAAPRTATPRTRRQTARTRARPTGRRGTASRRPARSRQGRPVGSCAAAIAARPSATPSAHAWRISTGETGKAPAST